MRKQCLVRPAAAIFRDAPDFGLPTPKSGYGTSSTLEKPPSGLGEVRFSLHQGPKSALYRIWFNALDNLNG
jgi:hypothetical protein